MPLLIGRLRHFLCGLARLIQSGVVARRTSNLARHFGHLQPIRFMTPSKYSSP